MYIPYYYVKVNKIFWIIFNWPNLSQNCLLCVLRGIYMYYIYIYYIHICNICVYIICVWTFSLYYFYLFSVLFDQTKIYSVSHETSWLIHKPSLFHWNRFIIQPLHHYLKPVAYVSLKVSPVSLTLQNRLT